MQIARLSAIKIMIYDSTHNVTALLKGRYIIKKNPHEPFTLSFPEKDRHNTVVGILTGMLSLCCFRPDSCK